MGTAHCNPSTYFKDLLYEIFLSYKKKKRKKRKKERKITMACNKVVAVLLISALVAMACVEVVSADNCHNFCMPICMDIMGATREICNESCNDACIGDTAMSALWQMKTSVMTKH